MRKAMMICGVAALLAVAGCGQKKADSGEEKNSSAAAQTDAQENGNNEEPVRRRRIRPRSRFGRFI